MSGTESPPKTVLRVAVRSLVAFALQRGDLHQHQFGSVTALEGIEGHQKVQSERGPDYQAEVSLEHTHETDAFTLEIGGRADGVFTSQPPVVEEIKTTRRPFFEIADQGRELHRGQAMMYACLYARTHDLAEVGVQVTYYNVDSGRTQSEKLFCDRAELDAFYDSVVEAYLAWAALLHQRRLARDQSLDDLPFPFPAYREGQRGFAVSIFRAIRDEQRLFAQAPTGIGKTMASLYPGLKALPEGLAQRVFFLTAKTSGAESAWKALELLQKEGLRTVAVRITAKDKICFDAPCNPKLCPYALGYYDRLRAALREMCEVDLWDQATVERLAQKHQICPFEYSLDLASDADVIVCDYNYAFDPGAYLRRFFDGDVGGSLLLIDEAHNLVDRSRAMYSAEISKRLLLDLRKEIAELVPDVAKGIGSINRKLVEVRKALDEAATEEIVADEPPEMLASAMLRFCQKYDHWLTEEEPEEVPENLRRFYFDVRRFLRSMDYYDDHFKTILRLDKKDVVVKIECLDASRLLERRLQQVKAAILFSATLSPFPYYTRLLAGSEAPIMSLPSPFDPAHLRLLVLDQISTKYKDRERTYDQVVAAIETTVSAKRGNYLVFFPSYRYLREVHARFEPPEGVTALPQHRGMNDADRDAFLAEFRNGTNQVGFAVMGGSFGEGIDLVGDALIGVIVVGVGLPMVCTERDLIRNHFNTHQLPGFDYAYTFPGMNRVLQTAGRVIRTAQDRGIVVLIDQRFAQYRYRQLYPDHWKPRFIGRLEDLRAELVDFWRADDPN